MLITPVTLMWAMGWFTLAGVATWFLDWWLTPKIYARFHPEQKLLKLNDDAFWAIFAPKDASGRFLIDDPRFNEFRDMILEEHRGKLGIPRGKRFRHGLSDPERLCLRVKMEEVLRDGLTKSLREDMTHFLFRYSFKVGWVGSKKRLRRQLIRSRIFGKHNAGMEQYWHSEIVGSQTFGVFFPCLFALLVVMCFFGSVALDMTMSPPGNVQFHKTTHRPFYRSNTVSEEVWSLTAKEAAEINKSSTEGKAIAYPTKGAVEFAGMLTIIPTGFFLFGLYSVQKRHNNEQEEKEAAGVGKPENERPKYSKNRWCLIPYVQLEPGRTATLKWNGEPYAGIGPGGGQFVPPWMSLHFDPDDPGDIEEVYQEEGAKRVERKTRTVPIDKKRDLGSWQAPGPNNTMIWSTGKLEGNFRYVVFDPSTGQYKMSVMRVVIARSILHSKLLDPDIAKLVITGEVPEASVVHIREAFQAAMDALSSYVPDDIDVNLLETKRKPERHFLLQDVGIPPWPFEPQLNVQIIVDLMMAYLKLTLENVYGLDPEELELEDAYFNADAEASMDDLFIATQKGNARRVSAAAKADEIRTVGKAEGDVLANDTARGAEALKKAIGGGDPKTSLAIAAVTGAPQIARVLSEIRGKPKKDKGDDD